MAGLPGGPGQTAGAKPGGLVAALKADAPPSNPATPNERINPQQTGLEHLKAASISLERSKEFITDPLMSRCIDAMIGALNKGLLQFDGQSVLSALQQAIGGSMPPAIPPPGAPGVGGPPAMGGPTGLAGGPAAPPAPGQAPPGAPPGAA